MDNDKLAEVPDIADIVAGALQTSRAHAYELMNAALAAQPKPEVTADRAALADELKGAIIDEHGCTRHEWIELVNRLAALERAAPAPTQASEPGTCSLGCKSSCQAQDHGCASECPSLPNRPTFAAAPEAPEEGPPTDDELALVARGMARLKRGEKAIAEGKCWKAPEGWRCTRAPFHEGPCAAVQDDAAPEAPGTQDGEASEWPNGAVWSEHIAGLIGTYLREPDETRVNAIAGIISRRLWQLAPRLRPVAPEATAQPVQGEPVASIYVSPGGAREFDDWRCELPPGRNILYTAPFSSNARLPKD